MSEADERVCIYAVILADTWDHLQKGSNEEMRPCTEFYMVLEANEGNIENRSDVMLPTASNNKPGSSILHPLELINASVGYLCKQEVTIVHF